jgi:hypothetical protein
MWKEVRWKRKIYTVIIRDQTAPTMLPSHKIKQLKLVYNSHIHERDGGYGHPRGGHQLWAPRCGWVWIILAKG